MNSLDPLEIESVLNLQTKLPPLIPTNKSKLTEVDGKKMKRSDSSSSNSQASSSNICSSIKNDLDNSKFNMSGYYSHRVPEINHKKNEQIFQSDEEILRLHSRSEGNILQVKEIHNINKENIEDQKPLLNFESRESTKKEPSIKEVQSPVKAGSSKNKPHNILKMIKHVSVAINKLRNRTKYRSLKFVTDEQTDLINDSTWFSERQAKDRDQLNMLLAQNNLIKYFFKTKIFLKKTRLYRSLHYLYKRFNNNILNKIGVIEPDHQLKMIFDFIIIILIILLFFILPLQASFNFFLVEILFPHNILAQNLISFIVVALIFTDIILKFFTGYYENGISVLQKDKIIKNYLQKHLIFDILAFLPVFLTSFRHTGLYPEGLEKYNAFLHLCECLIFCKLFEVFRAIQTLEEILHLNEQREALFELFKLITKILLFCHILACCWHAVANYSPYHNNLISEGEELLHANWLTRYLFFLYWTISIEKIEPRNNLELFFGFFALLGSEAVMGIIIEGIHSIIENLTRAGTERRENIKIINRYMRRKNIEYDVQVKVRKYLNFVYDQNSANAEKEHELIENLSNSLREEVLIRANGNILKMMPLFRKNFSEATLRKLVFTMKNVSFYPEEIIFQENDVDDRSIFLIVDGEIELFKENANNRISIKKLKQGDCFGEMSFFAESNRDFSCVSNNFSTVYKISRQDFISIIKENPEDYEKFRMISDKLINYQCFEDLYIKCFSCNRNDHTIERCPYLHFTPQRDFLICRHLFNKPTLEREVFARKAKRALNSRAKINKIQKKAKEFISSMSFEPESEDLIDSESSEDEEDDSPESIVAVNSGILQNNTVRNNKKSLTNQPSSGVIKNLPQSESETNEEFLANSGVFKEKEKNYEKKVTSEISDEIEISNSNVPALGSAHHIKRATIRTEKEKTNFEKEATRYDKNLDREISIKYNLHSDNMVENTKITSFSNRQTKVASGIYQGTSAVIENKNDMFMKDADKMTIFTVYFPYNNADNVLKNLKYKRLARRSTKYAKSPNKINKNNPKLVKKLSNFGLAVRLPSLNNESKDPSFFESPNHRSLKQKKNYFTEEDSLMPVVKKEENKKK